MIGLPEVLGGVLLLSLLLYALLAGADFGGGVWDLLARGDRAAAQRDAVARAIGPIWEANHVWMIVALVVLFSAFPAAFALVMTALHVPVTLMLVGIVLRGISFVFRKYDPEGAGEGEPSRWGRVFAISSVITPVMLGVVLGTVSTPALGTGALPYTGGFVTPWLRPFPWTVGLLALALFSFLAAVYLTVEAKEGPLAEDFRRRALASGVAVALTGTAAWALAGADAPELGLLQRGWGAALTALGALLLLATGVALVRRRYLAARVLAAGTTAAILLGWGASQAPWLVVGALTLREAAAPEATLRLLVVVLAAGSVVLVPALVYLYRTFKGGVIVVPMERGSASGPPGDG
ncbi:MAG TPA: cytochrome d ubiquinol oxidase subunit II [Candidatus Thermoplasmatota archaeon]